ncbi:molybdenum cofactor biosynthesis protein MoaE [Microbacterium sp. STN6]|uniref:molybdenum cofactor biosynthesis protein MoaE n=1 Tax=Microbacterium sp. STN6 TaxID=2995588 RepID=UPI002260B198|nr:molybdenum cofactor biosynthesis protein MoaE [Microbacterium sp. STN6]MCX7520880.1 molybdenum cofactor biosynthesis protein MoaE [Microbacterium sp. STN6]
MSVATEQVFAAITDEPIDEAAVRSAVEADESGAVVLFAGVVRNHDSGHSVLSLDYQAHPDAERVLAECCSAIADETGLRVAAAHRVGHLEVGDVALFAAASAAHRTEAFDACERLVERIKATVPIWKRQHGADGTSEWVGL